MKAKKTWFMRIAGEPLSKYVEIDNFTPTNHYWENTLLGKITPFSVVTYANFEQNLRSDVYQPGFEPLYYKNIKYPEDGNGPFKLVYASPSFERQTNGPIIGIFIYEINKDYKNEEIQS